MRDSDSGDSGDNSGSGGSGNNGLAQSLAFAAQLGFAIACPMVAFIGGGAWLDSKAGTMPLLLFAGILLGFLAAGGTLYQVIRLQTSKTDRPRRTSAPYKVEQQKGDAGTKSADKRGRNGR